MIRAITYIRLIVACRHAAAPEQCCDVDLLQIVQTWIWICLSLLRRVTRLDALLQRSGRLIEI